MENLSWDAYKDIRSWHTTFSEEEINALRLSEDQVHEIFGMLQRLLCDTEISVMTNVHPIIISRMRGMMLYADVAMLYHYPIVFTVEFMRQRIETMIIDDSYDPAMIVEQTGVNQNYAVSVYQQVTALLNS